MVSVLAKFQPKTETANEPRAIKKNIRCESKGKGNPPLMEKEKKAVQTGGPIAFAKESTVIIMPFISPRREASTPFWPNSINAR